MYLYSPHPFQSWVLTTNIRLTAGPMPNESRRYWRSFLERYTGKLPSFSHLQKHTERERFTFNIPGKYTSCPIGLLFQEKRGKTSRSWVYSDLSTNCGCLEKLEEWLSISAVSNIACLPGRLMGFEIFGYSWNTISQVLLVLATIAISAPSLYFSILRSHSKSIWNHYQQKSSLTIWKWQT